MRAIEKARGLDYEIVARTRLDLVFSAPLIFDVKDPNVYFPVSDGLVKLGWGERLISNYGTQGCPAGGCGPSPCGMMPYDFYAHGQVIEPRHVVGNPIYRLQVAESVNADQTYQ